jgi:N-acyl-D-aspartate/D-glutamate deacylase
MTDHDLVIRGGTIVDGTGAEPRLADIAVRDGVITEVADAGEIEGRAARTIVADGLLVTPGFVDIHAHYDGQATWDERMVPSSWHGVTTVVAGNCGVGFAPVRPADHDRLVELMEGVEDIPGVTLHEGLSWDWQSFPEFMDAVDGRPFDVDVAVQVPHGALRLHVMGERGAAREAATPDDIATMARLAAEAVAAGALGFTTSRTLNHRTSRGEPTPTLTAEADELVGIARAIGATGRGVLQVVSDFADVDAEFALCRRMAAESGRPLSFSLLQTRGETWRRQLDLLDAANADGVPMTAQVAPRAVGLLLGLQCTLHPFLTNPVYREIAELPLAERVAIMADSGFKARVLDATADAARAKRLGGRLIHDLDRMFELGDPPDYEPDPATSVAQRAGRAGRDPFEMVYDMLLADGGKAFLYLPMLNYADGNLDAAGEMLAHPHTVVGLADGGAHVGTICDASFPTTLLTHWGRDRERGRLAVPFLVHRQTQATARAVGLLDRGVLAPGYRADVNVIDFDALTARRPTMRHDLPAGGRRLVQGADGYVATIVAGHVTYEHGAATGPLPGRLVRGPQPAPAAAAAAASTPAAAARPAAARPATSGGTR